MLHTRRAMPKNIVLLSDGTGNSSAKLFKTNVWRLYGILDLTNPNRQIAHYSDGVGTSSFKPMAILGGIFGFGLKRNVLDLYQFACRNYRPGDHIWGFGFSRGAFTIRLVVGFIARQGLVPYNGDEAQLARDALVAYRAYRGRFNVTGGLVTPLRHVRDWMAKTWRCLRGTPQFRPDCQVEVDAIRFLGVWDTVSAYGGPIEEITRGIDYWLWPLSMPDRFMSAKITRACHALALDDERNSFWPVLWDEDHVSGLQGVKQPMLQGWAPPSGRPLTEIDTQRLSQVWFAGMHSSVGGGYSQDGLSYLSLSWMIDRAEIYGLRLNTLERARLVAMADGYDKLNDSRHGLAGYYRYKPRKLSDVYGLEPVKPALTRDLARAALTIARQARPSGPEPAPLIHESVFQRIAAGLDGYSPIVLPANYQVTTRTGGIRSGMYEHPTQALGRSHEQERAWNKAWLRRVVYFGTVFVSLLLAAFPLIVLRWPGSGQASWAAPLIPLLGLVGAFVPSMASPWLRAFQGNPGLFVIIGLLVAVLLLWGASLQRTVSDVMLAIWRPLIARCPRVVKPEPAPSDTLYRMRTSLAYRGFFYALTHWILPTIFAAAIVLVVLSGANRLIFMIADSLGVVCRDGTRTNQFDVRTLCHQVEGPEIAAGKIYLVTLVTTLPWHDGSDLKSSIETGPNGFGRGRQNDAGIMLLGIPIRRHLNENWFVTMVRVGRYGRDQQALQFTDCASTTDRTTCKARFQARSSGPAFVFVNDAVIAIPGLTDYFYRNNSGVAIVTVTLDQ